jgi:hypothetical protein
MAYKQETSIREKLQIDKVFRDDVFEEIKQTIEKLVEINKKPISKRYIILAIAEFQNKINGSTPVVYANDEIKDDKLYNKICFAIEQCIDNLDKLGKKPTQDELHSAIERLPTHLVTTMA